jgi:hypothetical protein
VEMLVVVADPEPETKSVPVDWVLPALARVVVARTQAAPERSVCSQGACSYCALAADALEQ